MEHISSKEASDAFNNLMVSGVIKLCLHQENKGKMNRLPLNTSQDYELMAKSIKNPMPVYVNDIYTNWYFYPTQLDELSPTIAHAVIKYHDGDVTTRMAWNSQ